MYIIYNVCIITDVRMNISVIIVTLWFTECKRITDKAKSRSVPQVTCTTSSTSATAGM